METETKKYRQRLTDQGFVGKQLDFHQDLSRQRWIIAANRSGKSEAGAREAVWHATGSHPYRNVPVPNEGWVIGLDWKTNLDVLLPKVLKFVPRDLLKHVTHAPFTNVFLRTGSVIRFKSVESKWDKFQSAAIDWAWFDEEPPKRTVSEVRVRLIDRKGCYWVTMTPLQGKTWVYTDIVTQIKTFPPGHTAIYTWSIYDNSALDRTEIDDAMGQMSEELKAARMFGEFIDPTGLIWPQYDERTVVVDEHELPKHWPVIVGMDPGYRHPFGAVFGAVDDRGSVVVWADYRRPGLLMSQHARNILGVFERYAPHKINHQALRWKLEQWQKGPQHDHGDDVVDAHFVHDGSNEQESRELLAWGIRSRPGDRRVQTGLDRVGKMFLAAASGQPGGLTIMRGRAPNLIEELRTYAWKAVPEGSKSRETGSGVGDDCADALRYMCMAVTPVDREDTDTSPVNSINWHVERARYARKATQLIGNENATLRQIVSSLERAF